MHLFDTILLEKCKICSGVMNKKKLFLLCRKYQSCVAFVANNRHISLMKRTTL